MREFQIHIHCFQEVVQFVCLATEQPFDIRVGNLSAKSFMGMLTLDFRKPITVQVRCSEEEFLVFCNQILPFLA